jgi:hypothetical protein
MPTAAKNAKARLRAAQLETETASARLKQDVAVVRAWIARHQTACIVAGGFLSGVALSSLPTRLWSKVGAVAAAGAAAVARSMLTPMIAGAFLARRTADSPTPEPPSPPPVVH